MCVYGLNVCMCVYGHVCVWAYAFMGIIYLWVCMKATWVAAENNSTPNKQVHHAHATQHAQPACTASMHTTKVAYIQQYEVSPTTHLCVYDE